MTNLTTLSGDTPLPFAFGAMQFGGTADADASRAMYEACRAAGLTHFDTAYVYTGGASETLLGQFAAQERDKLFIATKVCYADGAGRDALRKQFDTSRKRLDMDQVDLLYLHRFDNETPLVETYETLAEFHRNGWVRHFGVSNYAAWQVMKAQRVAERAGICIDVIQPMYNLVKRQVEVEILPMCIDQNIKPVPYSPLGGGLLTGKYASGGTGRLTEDARYKARYAVDRMHKTAADLVELAQDLGVAPTTLAVAWVAKHQAAPFPILSARSTEQLRPSLDALSFQMDDALYNRITALSETPAPATDRLEEA